MELSITRQGIKGGSEVFMVRDGKRLILSFPLSMRGLAENMVDEAVYIDGSQLPALVEKYSLEKAKQEPPGLPNAQPVTVPLTYGTQPMEFAAPIVAEDKPLEANVPTWLTMLAELLDCARQAEIQAHAAADDLEHATTTFTEAERRADLAWQAFNEALHASLPTGTRIRGVVQSDE